VRLSPKNTVRENGDSAASAGTAAKAIAAAIRVRTGRLQNGIVELL